MPESDGVLRQSDLQALVDEIMGQVQRAFNAWFEANE